MARILKGIDLSCVSPASTAICSSTTDPHNPSTIRHRHSTSSSDPPRPLHRRLNTYLQDQYRNLATNLPVPGPPTTTTTTPKCISDDPFTPRRTQQKTALFSSSTAAANTNRRNDDNILAMRRKSTSSSITTHHRGTTTTTDALIGRGRRCSSSRYFLLLRDNNFDKHVDDNPLAIIPCEPIADSADTSSALVVSQPLVKSSNYSQDHSTPTKTDPRMRKLKDQNRAVVTSQTSIRQQGKNQVVILKVSLHCKGCEGKLKKHLSKMQGVRSFSIDLEMKKVTVTLEGNMTPAHLLANISRVKYAEFWTSSPSSTSTSCSSLSPSSSSSTTSSKSEFSTNH